MADAKSTPASPADAPVRLGGCIEKLLRTVLEWFINGSLGFDIGLSPDFCSVLLRQEEEDDHSSSLHASFSCDISEGVPFYPLFKPLACALHQSIVSGSFFSRYSEDSLECKDSPWKQTKEKWEDLLYKGSELANILKNINFELSVQEPFFSQLKDGAKTVEGRCAVGDNNRTIAPSGEANQEANIPSGCDDTSPFNARLCWIVVAETASRNVKRISLGSFIMFNKCLVMEVVDVQHYASFTEMLETVGLNKVFPGFTKIRDGVEMCRKLYTEGEKLNGVIAISVSRTASQPYFVMADVISSLGYQGIQSLLGLQHTTGTVAEALPPARSTLLSSFIMPYRSDVKGSTLTVGARALTKHINRCSSNYWGELEGNDCVKNKHALEAIRSLVASCRWMNVHNVKPHGAVFEIRVLEGYGARWSGNGRKFIGFLEPYMEDGYSNRWRH